MLFSATFDIFWNRIEFKRRSFQRLFFCDMTESGESDSADEEIARQIAKLAEKVNQIVFGETLENRGPRIMDFPIILNNLGRNFLKCVPGWIYS